MRNPTRYADTADETGAATDGKTTIAYPGTPRWVKVTGIVALVLVVLFAGLHLTGNAPTHMAGMPGMQAP
jgi:hypothetical protein